MKIINKKFDTNQSLKSKVIRRKYCMKREASNICLNLISVSVLPQNACWSDMEGFKSYKYGPFAFYFRNANDEIIAGLNFYFSYNCNGKFNSSGKYLADVTISPTIIFANPGYDLTCNVTASKPINYGTKSDPIAGVLLKVQMQVESYHKLKSNSNYSMENTIVSKVLNDFDEPVNSINFNTNNDCIKAIELKEINSKGIESNIINSNAIICSSHSKDTDCSTDLKIKSYCRGNLNTEVQFITVGVRGDCNSYIVCGYGY